LGHGGCVGQAGQERLDDLDLHTTTRQQTDMAAYLSLCTPRAPLGAVCEHCIQGLQRVISRMRSNATYHSQLQVIERPLEACDGRRAVIGKEDLPSAQLLNLCGMRKGGRCVNARVPEPVKIMWRLPKYNPSRLEPFRREWFTTVR
jgi:hypothetical protein